MAEKMEDEEPVSFEDLLMSNTIEREALVNLLVKKVSLHTKNCSMK